jgi:peptidyl-prolyl cis-trans isomerase SurA
MKRLCLAFVALSCLSAFAAAQAAPRTAAPPAAKPATAPAGKPAAAPASQAATVPAPPPQSGQVVEEIIARVNAQIVTSSEFQRSKDQLRDEVKQQDAASADKAYTDREKDILRDLIDQQLLLQKGKDLDITGDTELIKWLDQMRKDMKLGSMEELEKAAAAQGISYEDFKQNKRNELITQKVIGEEVGSHLSVSKEEEQKFYDEHKNDMQQPEQVVLSEILIAPQTPLGPSSKAPAAESSAPSTAGPNAQNPPDSPANEADALAAADAKAKDLLDQIHKGAAFEDIAKKYSNGPTAADGGNLGAFKRGVLAKELEDRTFAMKTGEVTDVIRTKQGFVILKVNEHQEPGIPSLKTIEPKIQDALYYQKLQPALRAYLTKLREEAYINIQPGYVDSGASPNETQPIETVAAKESHARKLKKKKKLGFL